MSSLTSENTAPGLSKSHRIDDLAAASALAAVAATEKRKQNLVEEETDPRDPYHHTWSGVVAKTPQRGLRVFVVLASRVRWCGLVTRPAS